ncbi:MAG: (2Fe-2S)-binding protein, partial [Tahibacter sp.]
MAAPTNDAENGVSINGEWFRHSGDPDMPLLWYLRDVLHLTGSKF